MVTEMIVVMKLVAVIIMMEIMVISVGANDAAEHSRHVRTVMVLHKHISNPPKTIKATT